MRLRPWSRHFRESLREVHGLPSAFIYIPFKVLVVALSRRLSPFALSLKCQSVSYLWERSSAGVRQSVTHLE
jgi:hypothetical protein